MRVSPLWTWSECNGSGYHLQHLEKHARPKDTSARLIVFFVQNQDCILSNQNISFPKILCNPKLRWDFRIECICQLTFFFVFENVMWQFGFGVERQMKIVKPHVKEISLNMAPKQETHATLSMNFGVLTPPKIIIYYFNLETQVLMWMYSKYKWLYMCFWTKESFMCGYQHF